MNATDPANPWSKLLTTPPTTTVESILRYPAHSHDYRRHLADYEATRIEPGADPRATWEEHESLRELPDGTRDPSYSGSHRHAGAPWRRRMRLVFVERVRADGALVAGWDSMGRQADKIGRSDVYVPFDVVRWRRSEHRAELTRRAREHAAIRPGVYR